VDERVSTIVRDMEVEDLQGSPSPADDDRLLASTEQHPGTAKTRRISAQPEPAGKTVFRIVILSEDPMLFTPPLVRRDSQPALSRTR
jgi:hypothetical protein